MNMRLGMVALVLALLEYGILLPPVWAESYAYDSKGRLVVVNADDGKQTVYGIDPAGNRTAVNTVGTAAQLTPTANPDGLTFNYGPATLTFDPRTNDAGPSGQNLAIVGVTQPVFGSASFTGTAITYTPPANKTAGLDSFTYSVQNGTGGLATARVSITLINPPPVANPNTYAYVFGNPNPTFDPRSNDTDANGFALSITGVSAPARGSATFTPTSVTYIGPTDHSPGPDVFNYYIQNTAGGTASSTVTVNLSNVAPTAVADSMTVTHNTPTTIDPRINDTLGSGNPISVSAVTAPAHGSTTFSPSSVRFTPTSGYAGADSFNYTISDGYGGTSSAAVSVAVLAPAPLAVSLSATTWNSSQYFSGAIIKDPAIVTTVTGGTGPYVYLWERLSGSTQTVPDPNGTASTKWKKTTTNTGQYDSTWRCKITDAVGAIVYSATVSVSILHEGNE